MSPADLLKEPPATDVGWRIVTTILPVSSDTTAFATVVRYLSAGLLVVACGVLSYALLSMVLRAAERGEALSERQSGAAAMIRVVLGLGCLVPVAGGLSVVHYVLRDGFARPGLNMANAAAAGAAEYVLRDGHPLSPVSANGRDVVLAVIESEVCAQAYAAARANQVIDGDGAAVMPPPAGTEVVSPARASWFPWGEDQPARVTGYAWSWGAACGSLSLSTADAFGAGEFGQARRAAVAAVISEARSMAWIPRLAQAVKTLSETHVAGPDAETAYARLGYLREGVDAALREAGERYDRGLSAVAAKLSTGDDGEMRTLVLRDIEERGWYALGSYYRTLAHSSLVSAEAVAERAERTKPNPAAWETSDGAVGTALALVDGQLRRGTALAALSTGEALTGDAAQGSNLLSAVVESITLPVTDYLTRYDGARVDPIGDLMSLGSLLLVSGQAAWATALVAYGGSAVFGGIGGGLIDFVMLAGWPLIAGAVVVGAMLCYLVPLVPFIYATFALAAWAWEVVKAAIAVPIWAFLHVRLDEPELVGQAQRQGYISLLVGVMLRPIVTVSAFVAMHMMNAVILNAYLEGYNAAFKSSQSGQTIGAVGVIVSVVVMLYVQWAIIQWSYRMVTQMPAKVAEFIGYSASSWGDDDAGNTVVAGVTGGARHVPKPGGGRSGRTGGGSDDGGHGAKAGTKLGAKAAAAAAGGPGAGTAA
ncbi:DotA/TraY family protein [Aureimonas ureilytica]|uniref:DotA/TraY family protein n=1 Tax=Aureimonas ureilytica TaxID=401562 RepID=UPI003CEBE346